ncbi:hypothetical protein EYF80_040705 [Liparis tanakae]|uniref:Uncharacterized protein n=1 Tax=Liparis tanakae TaxID=230148 RepID=A0A4Z2G7J8_9TELE|nr:hypothetical protein EYF80_040705 [Liparis tanakae]
MGILFLNSLVLDNLVLKPHSASRSSGTTSLTSWVNTARGQGVIPLQPATGLGNGSRQDSLRGRAGMQLSFGCVDGSGGCALQDAAADVQ